MERITPLFPLHLVVFPNSFYPLHIFEERYKAMVENCQKNNISFVVVPVLSGTPASIGTTVSITQVTTRHQDGSFDIIVKGEERVRIFREWKNSTGYDEGLIESFPDQSDYAYSTILTELEWRFKDMLKKVRVNLEDNYWSNLSRAKDKTFKIAEKSGLSIDQQVELLALQNEEDRVRYLLAHFTKMGKYLNEREVLNSLILNDGYLNPLTED